MKHSLITRFFHWPSAAGVLLVIAASLAILLANTPLNVYYTLLIDTPVIIKVGLFEIGKPLLLWVNDGFMAIFFLLVGLELKREFVEGELADKKNVILPALGAVGGMVVPALIYYLINKEDPSSLDGWAIPAATDIAFALGVLSLLGSKVPTSLKIFLTSLAIFDDIGAILIIAFFYTSKISALALIIAAVCVILLSILNRHGVVKKNIYVAIGVIMWVALLKSGVHATLTGVILAMFIPVKSPTDNTVKPLETMEHELRPLSDFMILPIFAFCNAGITLTGITSEQLFHGVPVGIALGLFLGKQIGVFGFCWLGVKLRLTTLPNDATWLSLYGIAALCGIGFTMSLFIGSLAFEETGINRVFDERLGIIFGSLASGILGYLILRKSLK